MALDDYLKNLQSSPMTGQKVNPLPAASPATSSMSSNLNQGSNDGNTFDPGLSQAPQITQPEINSAATNQFDPQPTNEIPSLVDPFTAQSTEQTQEASVAPEQSSLSSNSAQNPANIFSSNQDPKEPIDSGMPQDDNDSRIKTNDALNLNSGSFLDLPSSEDDDSVSAGSTSNSSSHNDVIGEIDLLEKTVRATSMPDELAQRALRSIERLRRMAKRGSYSGEFETVEKYIEWITSIPWGKTSKDNLEIANAKQMMDQSHYGMNTVKNLVLDYLAVMQLQLQQGTFEQQNASANNMAVLRGSSANAPVMLFVGLQGVGKTSIAKSIANSMGREFVRVAVGAVGSVQALRGQSRAFLDAEPGQIIKALVRCKTMNPVILLDEIDKAAGNTSLLSDIMAALLEILDPEQNSTFVDHYIDYPVDLSQVFFICTANNLGTLSAALLDRMEVIRFTSYTDEEKTVIAKQYSLPKVLKNTGLRPDQLIIDEAVWPLLVRPVGFDAGLRQLERNLATLVRAAARKIVEGAPTPIQVNAENLRDFVLPDQGPLS